MATALHRVLDLENMNQTGIRQIRVNMEITHQNPAESTNVHFERNFSVEQRQLYPRGYPYEIDEELDRVVLNYLNQ